MQVGGERKQPENPGGDGRLLRAMDRSQKATEVRPKEYAGTELEHLC